MENWRQIQKNNIRDWDSLRDFLNLEDPSPFFKDRNFPLNIPRRLAKKIEKGNPNDPLLLQFFSHQQENISSSGFSTDPVEETSFQKTSRLLQKYPGRVLLIASSACAMHCRFCFRKNYPYTPSSNDFSRELDIIAADSSLHEVILSGGDPLSLSDEVLSDLIENLSAIPHLKLLRFHTRFPIGIPERITPGFVQILKASRLQTIFTLHTNHPRELDSDLFEALQTLQVPILSQTVLLKGVNDQFETLKTFFLTLVQNGVIPYYLHQLDRVQGTAHFEVPTEVGKKLIKSLREALPGYAVPTYVQEVPHRLSKTPTCEALTFS